MTDREYTFSGLTAPSAGCGYGKYVGHTFKVYGRRLFLFAMNTKPGDLPDDPWEMVDPGDPFQDDDLEERDDQA